MGNLARKLAQMWRDENKKELQSHQKLAFFREDYFRLSIEERRQAKEDMAALAGITDRLRKYNMSIGNPCFRVGNDSGEVQLELTPSQFLEATKLWDETEQFVLQED